MTHCLVWFKRDLRIIDHAPLWHASRDGQLTCAYFIEPSLWACPDAATQHYQFILESLQDLRTDLARLGLRLHVLTGEATDCLRRIHQQQPIDAIHSHEETGNGLTYARDKTVKRWCKEYGIAWYEHRQFGVTRGAHNRDRWKSAWENHCQKSLVAPVQHAQDSGLDVGRDGDWGAGLQTAHTEIPTAGSLGLDPHDPPKRQRGGRRQALATLEDFLSTRSQQYRGGISSPLSAPTACSRVSAYLSYGCLSMREVYQATQQSLAGLGPHERRQSLGLQSFVSRLYWHCHFIQKLEDEPEMELRNIHRGYDGLRELDWNESHFEALKAARTGWPLVDACVVMLRQTGWLNFRMRAMLVSVAAYPLWLHWTRVGHWLATQFLDYEPGIHWSQMQMQSGTTGINVPRIYNPIKQAQDHDPTGRFVRHWLPYMRQVPDTWLLEPWQMPANLQQSVGVTLGQDLPMPIVDYARATRDAKQRLFERRAQPEVKAAKPGIVKKHGSRKRLETSLTGARTVRAKPIDTTQLTLDF
jgi:deoxyribodipyrimidine photo-lyase